MPTHRRVVIGDAEQLASTSIVLAWARSSTLLLLGGRQPECAGMDKEGIRQEKCIPRTESGNIQNG